MAKKIEKKKAVKKEEKQSFLKKYLFQGIIFTFSFLLFANSISNGYNLDDNLVTQNHRLTSKGISAIPEIFTSSYYKDDMGYAYEYRPVVLSSFAIEHQLFGDNPQVSHFFNVLLYALCCVLLYRVLVLVSKSFSPAFSLTVALLFAAHSSHTEVVCSIKNRDEILGLIFCLLTFLAALKAVQTGKRFLLLAVPVLFCLALMNKITFLPFAGIILIGLMLFTEVNLSSLFIVAVSLALPSFFLINTGNFFSKVFIAFGLAIAPVFLMLVFRFQTVLQYLKKTTAVFFKPPEQAPINTEENDEYEGFKGFFKNLAPTTSYFSFYPIAGTLFLALTYFTGAIFKIASLEITAFFLLVLLVWKGKETWSWCANVVIYFCLALTISLLFWDPVFIGFVFISLCYPVFFGNRKLRVPAALALLTAITISLVAFQISPPFLYFIVFALLRTRLKWLAGVLIIGSAANEAFLAHNSFIKSIYEIKQHFSTGMINNYFGLLVDVPVVAAILFRKGSRYLIWGYMMLAVVMLVTIQKISHTTLPLDIVGKIEIIGKDINTNITSEKQDRPINFIEQPVSPNDPWQIRAGTSMRILFHYFTKTIVPYPLAFYYGYKFIVPEKITNPIPLLSVFIHVLLLLAALYFFKRNSIIFFGIAIYLISIVTFANYFAPVPGMVGDRYLLIPSLGWSILLAVILFKIWKINAAERFFQFAQIPKGFKYSFGILLCFYSLITFSRNFDWKDNVTLFANDIKYVNQSAMAHNLLAIHLMKSSESVKDPVKQTEIKKEALLHFKRALEIYPAFLNVAYDIGRVYLSLEMPDSAIAALKHAVDIGSTFSGVYKALAELLFAKGNYDQAIPYFEYVIKAVPTEFNSYDKLSYIYFKRNQFEKSIGINKKAMEQFPQLIDPVFNIGRTYMEIKQLDSARYYLLKADQISPGNTLVKQLLEQLH